MPQPQSLSRSAATETVAGQFDCSWSNEGRDAAWVRPAGELDIAGQARFTQVLSHAGRAARLVVLDLRELTFMDCSGLQVIVEASARARGAGWRLLLIRGPAQIHRLFTLTGCGLDLEILDLDPAEPQVESVLQLARQDQVA